VKHQAQRRRLVVARETKERDPRFEELDRLIAAGGGDKREVLKRVVVEPEEKRKPTRRRGPTPSVRSFLVQRPMPRPIPGESAREFQTRVHKALQLSGEETEGPLPSQQKSPRES
jgi:hypothetical protein